MLSTGICRWLFLLVSLATWVIVTNSKEMRVVCYYTNWSVYRPGNGKFSPQNINPYLCTHLIYAFGGFTKENTLKPFDKYQDIEKGGYAKFTGLKTYNKDLKTLLAIGGWNEGSTRFSPMVANPERRKEFARNAIKFLRLNHFDGLDLDWEYPSFRDGGKSRDKDNYPLLVKELREEFEREAEKTGRPRLLLTMAVPAGIEYINKGFDVPKLTKYLDWMNILSYDFHSAFEPAVNHHAPLYSLEEESEYNFESDLNIDYAIKHYLKHGAEPSKLVLGIPTYGRSYTLYNPDAFELGSPADGPGSMGEETRENGYLAYYEVCDYVKNQGWEVEQPNPQVMGPYAFKDNQWVGYDDEEIVKKKAEYVVENGLGGIMFWSIDNDDFRGNCHGKPYPLIEAGRAALIEAYGLTDDNLIEKPSKPLKSRTRTRTKTANKIEPETEKPKKPTSSRRRNRTRQNKEKTDDDIEDDEISTKRKTRRKNASKEEETSSYSSLKVVTPSYTTPAPPSTPELDGGFKCEDEGFYPHPKDCKKYFWCLNGAGDSGIIAHQFTCPAGLFFNKAADSCDYSQNVLCKKSAQKASTTKKPENSESSATTPATISFTTRRPLPKITAATSRTTLKQTTTTTTEAYEDEEYDDDDEEDEFEEEEGDRKESEEDPRVIKELLELIKKAGGIEELEKQFKIKGNTSSNSEHVTTKSPIFSKSLYERVLSKAIKSTSTSSRNTSFRNSRGPQSIKTEKDEKSETRSKPERGKLQYTSISRFRPSTIDKNEEETDQVLEQNTENQPVRKATEKYPSYTNIRRARVSTTSSRPETDRNKILGETDDEENDDDDDDEDTEDEETDDEYVLTTKRTHTPQYVNIRRQRPTTTEESSTSKYLEFRRGTTTENATSADGTHTTLKYKILRRGTTTTSKPESDNNISSSTRSKTEETTVSSTADVASRSTTVGDAANTTTEENRNEYLPIVITTTTGTYVTTTDDINLVKSENNESKNTETSNVSSKPNLINSFSRKRPQLFEPRPFSKSTEATTSRPRATQTPKVSESSYDLTSRSESENNKITKEKTNINFRSRGNSRFHPNRNVNAEENEKQITPSRRRLIVTEKYVEENRTYRPSEIADLSSLTAVDFDNIKGINPRNNFRRRRPIKPTQTTEKVIDVQSTPNALKRRRIHVSENETTSGETKIVREYRTSPTTESSSPFTPRNRKIIRRFRTSTRASVSPQNPEEQHIIQRNRTALNPSKSILDTPLKTNEVDDDSFEDTTTEEEENIKLSESNIRENSDINSFKPDPKLRRKLIKSDLYGKSNVYEKNLGNQQSVENETSSSIEPSTSSFTEPSIFHRTRKIIRKIVPTQPSKIADKEVDSDQIFGRKRKIIRKLRPISKISLNNTSSVQASETKPNGTNDPIFNEEPSEPISDNINEEEETLPKKIFRPKFGNRKTTSTTAELDATTPKIVPRNKTILLRGPSRSYRPTFRPTPSDKDISSEPSVELERSSPKYNYISRRRPTTETITEKPQIIVTTVIEEDQTDINELTTENIISTYDVEQKTADVMITTENLLSETTTTEGNVLNFEISTQYTDNLSTNLNIESSTKLNNAEEEVELSTIITEEPTEQTEYITDSTTELPKTTLTETSSTVSGEPLNVSYHNTLKKVDLRPKFDPSKLNLTNSPTTEPTANVLKPKLNYKSRYQFSTSGDTLTTSTTEKINDLKEISRGNIKENNRFNRYRSGFRTTQKIRTDDPLDNVESSSALPINKYLYKTRKPKPQETREKEETEDDTVVNIESSSVLPNSKSLYKFRKPKPQDTGENEDIEDDSDKENNNKEEVSEKPKSRFFINKNTRTTKTAEIPYLSKLSTKLPSFAKTTTEASNVNDELKDINTDAVKNRNKSLFKNRKVNPNLLSPSTSPSTVAIEESTTYKDEDSTDSSTSESTEHPTTLVHIFAEKSENDQTTTSRVERLIEVNRIVNVKTKQDVLKNHHLEHSKDKESSPFYDKIGAINRVTVIKVVDKDGQLVSNETLSPVYIADSQTTESPIKSSVDMIIQIAKIQEIPPPDNKVNLTNIKVQIKQAVPVNREERRFDFIGGGKLDDSKVRNVGKAEIIDGISHINVITPRPIYLTESSTIALEGLFQTEKPTLFTSKNTINEELLETENSKYVNVRILHPDEEVRLNEDVKNTKVIPIKLLKQDDQDFIMRARVIEVSPKSPFNSIKIVPIKVEAAKKMPPPLPLIRINREYN